MLIANPNNVEGVEQGARMLIVPNNVEGVEQGAGQAPPLHDILQTQAAISGLFPDLDLLQVFRTYGHFNADELANFIAEHVDNIPKKKKEAPKKDVANETVNISILTDDEDADGGCGFLIDRLFADIARAIRHFSQSREGVVNVDLSDDAKELLANKFTNVRIAFIRSLFIKFMVDNKKNFNFISSALCCFFAQYGYAEKLKQYKVEQVPTQLIKLNGTPMQLARRPTARLDDSYPEQIRDAYARFTQLMADFKVTYPQLINSIELQMNAINIPYVPAGKMMDCLVCYDSFLVSRMVFCQQSELDLMTTMEKKKRRSSVHLLRMLDSPRVQQPQASEGSSRKKRKVAAESVKTEEIEEDRAHHGFCRECIRGSAQAATTDARLAEGGLGLRCMENDCKHILRFAEIRRIIPAEVRKKLEERIREENLGMAHLINLERCRDCNFAMEMDQPAEVNKVFKCYNCGVERCRLCDRNWNGQHFGMSCKELDKKLNDQARVQRNLEAKLNEAVVRKCTRCNLTFVKETGCNKMTCRCGLTMCYICRTTDITYDHFCQHMRDPRVRNGKCDQCPKTCLLWVDASKIDDLEMEKIRQVVKNGEGERPLGNFVGHFGNQI